VVGVRLAGAVSVLVLVAAEMIGAKAGLGYLVIYSQYNFQIPQMYFGILSITALGVAFNGALVAFERYVVIWKEPSGRENDRPFNSSLSLDDVVAKYPRIPRLIALKIDVQRPGVRYTDRALSLLDPAIHQVRTATIFGSRDGAFTPLPDSLMLRDGTSIVVGPTPEQLDPYVVDSIDGRLLLLDGGEPLEESSTGSDRRYWSGAK